MFQRGYSSTHGELDTLAVDLQGSIWDSLYNILQMAREITIQAAEYEQLIKRSEKLKKIEDMLEKAYETDDSGELVGEDDLASIGESLALIMGYL
jgi:hypothetical protein